jgi:glucose/arabinose dehydrogenase
LDELWPGLHFPTSVAVGDDGDVFVAESGLPFGGAPPGGRVWRLAGGERELVAAGLSPPVNGLTRSGDGLLVSEGGAGRILRLHRDGSTSTVVEHLPGPGDYQVNMAVHGPDGKVYFSQGSMTNTAIVGVDSIGLGWLARIPDAHDIPGFDVELAGVNVETDDPRPGRSGRVTTGAFVPFGTPGPAGRRVAGAVRCTAAMMRCDPDGSGLEMVAWGLRNAFGIGFLPDGRLLALDQGADDRGSRPLGNVPDLLFEVTPGGWYGWPDFVGGVPVTDPGFRPRRGPAPRFVIANHHELPAPASPLVRFPAHTSATRFCVLPAASSWAGHLVVALFGDEAPMTAPSTGRVGRHLVRVDTVDWSLHPLAGPPLHRPIDVTWDPAAGRLLVLDFGRFEMHATEGVVAEAGSGSLWSLPLENRGEC